jgi:hypothetical protein
MFIQKMGERFAHGTLVLQKLEERIEDTGIATRAASEEPAPVDRSRIPPRFTKYALDKISELNQLREYYFHEGFKLNGFVPRRDDMGNRLMYYTID